MNIKEIGKIKSLFISKKDYDGRIHEAEVAVDQSGIFADKFYGKDETRSVLIASIDAYELAKQNGIELEYGDLGENILVDFDLSILDDNMKIKIGDVNFQITQHCTICNGLSKINKALPKLLKNDRGIFAKVLDGGLIKANDTIGIVNG